MKYVVKKDGTLEEFNVQKVVEAVGKSATRVLIKFTPEQEKFICQFVEERVEELGLEQIQIAQMHNIVEGALERVNAVVAKSYRDYRNYKQDFVQMLDDVYKKSQNIMYIGDKENANTDSALVSTKRSLIFNELNRRKVLLKTIVNMAHLGPRAFEEIGGEVVQTVSFVVNQCNGLMETL